MLFAFAKVKKKKNLCPSSQKQIEAHESKVCIKTNRFMLHLLHIFIKKYQNNESVSLILCLAMYNKILFCVKGCQVQDVVPCTSSVQHTQMDMCEGFEEIPLISHSSIQANKKEIAIQTTTNITANSIKCFRSVKTQTDNFFLCVCEETNNQIVRLKSVGLSY